MSEKNTYNIAFFNHSVFGGFVDCVFYRNRKLINIHDDELAKQKVPNHATADFRLMI